MDAIAGEAANYIKSLLPKTLSPPQIGVICGTGLGGIVSGFHSRPQVSIPYIDIPNFPTSTVVGHENRLVLGTLGEEKVGVVAMVGRVHFYEGHDMATVTFPIRVLHLLGINTLIVTNAAGGLDPSYSVGDLVVLKDHINFPGLAGNHPLCGPNADQFGPRFPELSDAYCLTLRQILFEAAALLDVRSRRGLHEGIYAMVSGPSFETGAEARMIRLLGADVVGMSSIPEVIVARHCGIRVLCISVVTAISGFDPAPSVKHNLTSESVLVEVPTNLEGILQASKEATTELQSLLKTFINLLK